MQDTHYTLANLGESNHWLLAQDKGEKGRSFVETLLVLPLYVLYLADPPSHRVSGEMSQCKTSIRVTAGTQRCAALPAALSQGLAVAEENICTSTEAINKPFFFIPLPLPRLIPEHKTTCSIQSGN